MAPECLAPGWNAKPPAAHVVIGGMAKDWESGYSMIVSRTPLSMIPAAMA